MLFLLFYFVYVERSGTMDTKQKKEEKIRAQIIDAAKIYRDHLAGRVFLYVYGDSSFEVVSSISLASRKE